MVRRTFLKNAALAAVGTAALSSPVSAMLKEEKPVGKKKVLLVNGSPRPDGNTFCALQEIEAQLKKHGIETEIYQIGNKPVRMCINCGGCRRNGGKGCVFNDDPCNEIAQKMAESDALIVGTPVYYGQPNGGILAVMQRLFFASGRLVQNKPAAAVAVCRRGGATATLQTMNMMFEMMNMPVVTLPSTGTSPTAPERAKQRWTRKACRPCARWATTWPGSFRESVTDPPPSGMSGRNSRISSDSLTGSS